MHELSSGAGAPDAATKEKPSGKRHRAPKQLSLPRTRGWGGKRRGAGRRRRNPKARPNVWHRRRPPHKACHPVHITLRAKAGLPSFREQLVQRMLAEVLRDQRRRYYESTFRVLHYSIQRDHLHLIVEADTQRAKDYKPLRSGVSGLAIAFARRLNMILKRRGSVWADRYHRRDLKNPTMTLNAFKYVFDNYTHHGVKSWGDGVLDPYSSAWAFDGWAEPHFVPVETERWRWFLCHARTWLASRGYRKAGTISIVPRH